jgi:hypothetical protein
MADTINGRCDPQYVIATPEAVFQSFQGRYFMGQTQLLLLGDGANAWGGLINPSESGVNLFINVFTVSNYSAFPFVAQAWFNSTVAGPNCMSTKVTSGNMALQPLPRPRIRLNYAEMVQEHPSGGVNPFNRIIPARSTNADVKAGEFIIPPGGSFLLYLVPPGACMVKARIAFGWWEECICD